MPKQHMAGRQERELEQLRKRVMEGSYRVDPRAVADAILRRARLSRAARSPTGQRRVFTIQL